MKTIYLIVYEAFHSILGLWISVSPLKVSLFLLSSCPFTQHSSAKVQRKRKEEIKKMIRK